MERTPRARNWKGGITLKKYFCKKCDNKISTRRALYGKVELCRSCSHLGMVFSEERKRRIKESLDRSKNDTRYKKGLHSSINTEFKKGNSGFWLGKKRPDISGKKHFNWHGGNKRGYPFDFSKELKAIIRQRDNQKCRLCGCPQEECFRKLDVHHIDYDKKNLDPKNLISLCNICHGKTYFNREYWKDFYQNMVSAWTF